MRFVEAEDLFRRIGSVTKAIPNLAFLAFVAAEEHMAIAVGTGDERDDRFGLGKSRQIVEVAVVAKREQRIAVTRDFRRGRHERETAAGVLVHLLQ